MMTYWGVFLEKAMNESSILVDLRRLPSACARERNLAGSFTLRLVEMRCESDLRTSGEPFSSAEFIRYEVSPTSPIPVKESNPSGCVLMSESSYEEYRVTRGPSSALLLSAGPEKVADLDDLIVAISLRAVVWY